MTDILPDPIEAATPVDVADLADALATLRAAKAEIEKWKAVETAATDAIKERLGESAFGTVNGATVVTWKHSARVTVDVVRMRTDMGDLLAPYLRTTATRTFKLLD